MMKAPGGGWEHCGLRTAARSLTCGAAGPVPGGCWLLAHQLFGCQWTAAV